MQGNLPIAEYMLRDAIPEAERFGKNSIQVFETKSLLMEALTRQGKVKEADELLIDVVRLGEVSDMAETLEFAKLQLKAAEAFYGKGEYARAEPFALKAFKTHKKVLGPDHPDTARVATNLAYILQAEEKYAPAEVLYKSSMTVLTKSMGAKDPFVVNLVKSYAVLLEVTHRELEAEHLLKCVEA